MVNQYKHLKTKKGNWKRGAKTQLLVDICNKNLFPKYGVMTLRQIFYKLVSQNVIANTRSQSNDLSRILCEARRNGKINPSMIIDPSREILNDITTFKDPMEFFKTSSIMIHSLHEKYHIDLWENQIHYPIIYIEKEALSRFIAQIAFPYQVKVVVAKGFGSDSQLYELNQRLPDKKIIKVLMFVDHDYSGLNMVLGKSLPKRLKAYFVKPTKAFDIKHIALTDFQINKYNLPTNPDKKQSNLKTKYGMIKLCELDALDPIYLRQLVIQSIENCISDKKDFNAKKQRQQKERGLVQRYYQKQIP